jgi:hypothetical protein
LPSRSAKLEYSDLDLDIIEDGLVGAVREHVGDGKRHIVDALLLATQNVAARKRPQFARDLSSAEGLAWGRVQAWLAQAAPPQEVVGNQFDWARPVVLPALIAILGPQGSRWRTESRPRPDRPGSSQTWIHRTEPAEPVNQATPPEDRSD